MLFANLGLRAFGQTRLLRLLPQMENILSQQVKILTSTSGTIPARKGLLELRTFNLVRDSCLKMHLLLSLGVLLKLFLKCFHPLKQVGTLIVSKVIVVVRNFVESWSRKGCPLLLHQSVSLLPVDFCWSL